VKKPLLLLILLTLVLVVGLVPLLVACGGTTTTTTAATTATTAATTATTAGSATTAATTATTAAPGETKTLTIGGIAFLTGPAAAGGMACKTGWELAAARINDAGGLKIGNDTYMIDLKVEDDAMSVDQAVTAAQKMIQQDGATYIIGPLVDAFKNTIYPICADAGAMLASVDTCNASAQITYEGNTDVSPERPLYIRCCWANDEITPYLLDYLQANYPTAKKVAVCGVTENCSVGLYDWIGPVLTARGLERVGDLEQIAPDASDFNPSVTRILANNPDAIWVCMSTPTTWGFVAKAARELGFTGPIFCSTHLDVSFVNTVAGGGLKDLFGVGVTLGDMDPLSQDMVDARAAYVAKGYAEADEIADVYLVGYNGLWVLLQAIEKAQSVDPQVVYEKYQTLTNAGDLKTLWGDAYVGGLQSTGVNAVLNEPYWIDAIGSDGVAKNVQHIEMIAVK
jgi:branched-chain amino acid transport system substrate-binding protein